MSPSSNEPASDPGDSTDDLRDRLTNLDHASRRSPEDIEILKESVLVCEQLGDEEEAARYRFRIWRIDPGDPSLQGKEIAQRTPRIEAPESLRLSFREDWPRVRRYPMEGWGRATLIGGAILMALGRTFGDIPVGSSLTPIWIGVAMMFWIITWGTLASYWLQIVEASAMGKEEPPEWTDFRDFWSSMFGPFFSMLFCLTLTLGPALAWLILCGNQMGFNFVTV
ncbi:MAG: hypothetical protein O6952_10605, partial [Planctomycetota bacterium]|nr:hypothetical protein [Planctomycetota bacterium]